MEPENPDDFFAEHKPNDSKRRKRMSQHEREVLKTQVSANYLAGATQAEIGKMLGVSQMHVSRLLKEIEEDWRKAGIMDTQRRKERAARRYDVLINAVWSRAVAGNLSEIDRVAKLQEGERKLLGLDAPAKAESVVMQQGVTLNADIDFNNLNDEAAEALMAFYRALEKQQEADADRAAADAQAALTPL